MVQMLELRQDRPPQPPEITIDPWIASTDESARSMGHHCCRDSTLLHLVTDLHERQIAFVRHALFISGALCSLRRMLSIVGMSRDELVDRVRPSTR
jgi:hypothetical protein